jgi:hypothetical protein
MLRFAQHDSPFWVRPLGRVGKKSLALPPDVWRGSAFLYIRLKTKGLRLGHLPEAAGFPHIKRHSRSDCAHDFKPTLYTTRSERRSCQLLRNRFQSCETVELSEGVQVRGLGTDGCVLPVLRTQGVEIP